MAKTPVGVVPSTKGAGANANDPYGILGINSSTGQVAWADVPIIGGNQLLGRPATATAATTSGYKGPRGLNIGGTTQVPNDPTAAQLLHDFTQMRGVQLAQLQDQMYRAGFYGSDKPNYGTFDISKDLTAFKTMLIGHIASGQQAPLTTYLSNAVTDWQHSGAGRAPAVIRLEDPAALRVTLQKTAQDLYGQYLSDDQVQNFITSFQGLQTAQQQQAYNAGGFNPETGQSSGAAGTTATSVFTPNAPAEAEEFIRKNYPNEVAGNYLGNQMNNILDVFRKSA